MLPKTTEASVRKFFTAQHFAVVGANSNPQRFGNKVLLWYQTHKLPVTPINPTTEIIETSWGKATALKNISLLPNPKETAISVITPPTVTLEILKEAKRIGIPAVWLQPGTYDEDVMKFAHGKDTDGYAGEVVAGPGGRGGEGWCVLVDGNEYAEGFPFDWATSYQPKTCVEINEKHSYLIKARCAVRKPYGKN